MQASNPPFIRFCKKLGLLPEKVSFYLSDSFFLLLSLVIAFCIRAALPGFSFDLTLYLKIVLIVLLGPLCLGLPLGVYMGIPTPRYNELRRIVTFVSITFATAIAFLFLAKNGEALSRGVLFGAWILACFLLPLGREFVRHRFARYPWWGYPLVVLNSFTGRKKIWHYLRRHPEYGFNPVASVDLPESLADARSVLEDAARKHPGSVALVAGLPSDMNSFLSVVNVYFSRVLILPETKESSLSFWLTPCDVGVSMGFLLQQRLHDRRRLFLKRSIDLIFCALGAVLVVPVSLVLALAIRLDSRGPILYRQKRVGQGGREIMVHKFRTMARDADLILEKYLADNPDARDEWERDHKLRRDPRITRVGRFLRHTSLDELPQLIDVLAGNMSIVGPRPIVNEEISKYGPVYSDYILVKPGITGLWQVSGRNDTSYEERVAYDFYYINNWSIWMDIWILCRTVPVVILGRGAY